MENLKDRTAAEKYLDRALVKAEPGAFLHALKQVINASGGMVELSKKTGIDRAGLYKMLTEHKNPTYRNLRMILRALGFRLKIEKLALKQSEKRGGKSDL